MTKVVFSGSWELVPKPLVTGLVSGDDHGRTRMSGNCMSRLSLFRFSRQFFVIFLLSTILPSLCFLGWVNYDMRQNMDRLQRQELEMAGADWAYWPQQYLFIRSESIERQLRTQKTQNMALNDYLGILKSSRVFWADEPEGRRFLANHAMLEKQLRASQARVVSDYFVKRKNLWTVSLIRVGASGRVLVSLKPVVIQRLLPHGPFNAKIYRGDSTQPSHWVETCLNFNKKPKVDEGPFGIRKPHPPFMMPAFRHGRGGELEPGGQDAAMPGRGSGFREHECYSGPLSDKDARQPALFKALALKNQAGQTLMTVQLTHIFSTVSSDPPFTRFSEVLSILLLCTGVFSSLMMGRYIQRNFVEPLRRLSQVTGQVQDGELSGRVQTDDIRQSEVQQTLLQFNQMLEGLNEKEELRHSFVSNLTHDFRTPLIAQNRTLELLAQQFGALDLEREKQLALGLLKNSEHLLDMVNQLLETYQTEAGMLRLKEERVDLPVLVKECFGHLSTLAGERGVVLRQQFPEGFPQVSADSDALRRVFINLISNGIDNISRGDQIEVFGRIKDAHQIELHVKDNGPGISQEVCAHLFERYYAGTGDTRKLGSGLGLYICKLLVEAHHGRIMVESVESEYTDFIIQLPI